jgi:outer membrane biosynthesis protein TonB
LNSDTAQIPFITPAHAPADRRLDVIGASVTIALHVLLIAIMLRPALENSSRARSSAQQAAMQVSLVTEQQTPAPVTPVQPVETPQEPRPVDTLPTPLPAPQAATKPAESKSTSKSAASSSTAAPSDQAANDSKELEDVIGRIRDNWLEPPGISPNFRCRLRIDYAIGGKIMAVNFLKGCGALALDDSVKRAIWKTQSLSLRSAKREAGSIEIDFTP